MALRGFVFDVGETLVDETRLWERAVDEAAVPRFTVMGVLGGLAARGAHHTEVWRVLGVGRPLASPPTADFYPDALPCLARLRSQGFVVGAVGNTPVEVEEMLRGHVDLVGSSARWGVEKPSGAFFERIAAEAGLDAGEIAYVGDRLDNDVEPSLAAGMVAVHVRRGPWGFLHDPPQEAIRILSLDELPSALASLA